MGSLPQVLIVGSSIKYQLISHNSTAGMHVDIVILQMNITVSMVTVQWLVATTISSEQGQNLKKKVKAVLAIQANVTISYC